MSVCWFLKFPCEAETQQINDIFYDSDMERIQTFPFSLATEFWRIQPIYGTVSIRGEMKVTEL